MLEEMVKFGGRWELITVDGVCVSMTAKIGLGKTYRKEKSRLFEKTLTNTFIALHFPDVLEKVVMEFRTQCSSDKFLTSLGSGRLLKNIRTTAYVSSEQATACHGDVEAPSIARTSQESKAETAKPTLEMLGRPIQN
ncbi:hypothetical protein EV424DRAFT_1351757 [Suillus variegatus]|nr:hypothetical protein EV424DRAFT_1351757 [Suillus variegatus]